MAQYDIFNGDADGICSLIQLRLAEPRDAILITGVKRDIKLLGQITAESGDEITVLDISMEKNIAALNAAIEAGANVFYADHHRSGDIPETSALEAHINTASNTCTGLIVDYVLGGNYRLWAIVAAYGDNITQVADEYASKEGLTDEQRDLLRQLGVAMNYNGYGNSEADLYYPPAELFRLASPYTSPFDFIEQQPEVYRTLTEGYDQDMSKGLAVAADRENGVAAMITLPDQAWARRVSGVLGNELANQYPDRAHAILTEIPNSENVLISIRAPKSNPNGADVIATHFGGGGRKNAAGINELAPEQIDEFWDMLTKTYS